jgi:hypothetical protein
MTTVWPSTRRRYAFHPSLRRLLERRPRQAQERRRPGRTLLSGRATRACSGAGRTVPRRPPASLGGDDPPSVRSRPPRVSSLRERNARDRLHHRARPHRSHPRSPPKARPDLSPASPTSAFAPASGHPRLRSPLRSTERWKRGEVSARDVCPCLHQAPDVQLTHGPSTSRSSGRAKPRWALRSAAP